MLTVYELKYVEFLLRERLTNVFLFNLLFITQKQYKAFTYDILCRAFVLQDVEYCWSTDLGAQMTSISCLTYGSYHENMFWLISFLKWDLYHIPFCFSWSESDEDKLSRFGLIDTNALETLHLILSVFYLSHVYRGVQISFLKTATK